MYSMIGTRTLVLTLALTLGANASTHGAAINGTVVFEGRAPTMPLLKMAADPGCKVDHVDPPRAETLVLGEGQTIANILVKIKSGLSGKEYPVPKEPVVVTQSGCMYSPHVFGVRAGQPIEFMNPDKTLHNINAKAQVNRGFNISMPDFRKSAIRTFAKSEPIFSIDCDVHKWMSAWCAVIDHPFFEVTGKDGRFSIEGLDAGTYEIEAWHERLGTQTATITVGTDEIKTHDFTFSRARNSK